MTVLVERNTPIILYVFNRGSIDYAGTETFAMGTQSTQSYFRV